MENLKIVYLNPKELTPYGNNARAHAKKDIDAIRASIREFGFSDPIGIWSDQNYIVEGHGRRLAAIAEGLDSVPCIRLDHMTDEQRKAYALAHNKTAELSEWNFGILDIELAGIQEIDMSVFGFEPIPEPEPEVVEDEVPEEAETRCKPGDLWKLGDHRLICGDSTDVNVIDRLMDGVKADMVFTDPPYGNSTSGKYGRRQLGARTIAGDEDLSVFNEFVSIMNTDKIVYFLQWRTLAESFETIRNKGLRINTVGVWDKKNAGLNGAGGISEQWEAVIFAGNIKYKKFGGNVFSIAREQHKRKDSPHPHQKPIKLLAEIFDYLDGCENILDPFGGSGSTLIACEQLNRKCYMAEFDPHYCDVIIERWERLTGKKAELMT